MKLLKSQREALSYAVSYYDAYWRTYDQIVVAPEIYIKKGFHSSCSKADVKYYLDMEKLIDAGVIARLKYTPMGNKRSECDNHAAHIIDHEKVREMLDYRTGVVA
tara:strand:- start:1127 stop:1441 length:315 start_codon:yes stop_codon:yes gene_type:complete